MQSPESVRLAEEAENAAAKRNAMLYAACAALGGAAAPVSIALGGLAGSYLLAADKSLATAPVTGFNVGLALAAIPAAALMRRIGRRNGFMTGAAIGIVGMALAALALIRGDFWLFALALAVNGSANAFTQQYRFAATDRGTPQFRAKAIGWTLTGGVAAAFIGPQLILQTRDLMAPIPFAGAFLSATALFALSILALSLLAPAAVAARAAAGDDLPARPLVEIVTQPVFVVAALCGAGSYALMSFVMTAAPLAMVGCGFSVDDATLGIQWHVLAMFAPSFVTGNLIVRYGKAPVIAAGMAILVLSAFAALGGLTLANFWGALILLGVGWNFAFIGATALVTDAYRHSEKSKAQGANDFVLFSSVAFASLMSGNVLTGSGWATINMIVFPVTLFCLAALAWLVWRGRTRVAG
jgi:MFS family permease